MKNVIAILFTSQAYTDIILLFNFLALSKFLTKL